MPGWNNTQTLSSEVTEYADAAQILTNAICHHYCGLSTLTASRWLTQTSGVPRLHTLSQDPVSTVTMVMDMWHFCRTNNRYSAA